MCVCVFLCIYICVCVCAYVPVSLCAYVTIFPGSLSWSHYNCHGCAVVVVATVSTVAPTASAATVISVAAAVAVAVVMRSVSEGLTFLILVCWGMEPYWRQILSIGDHAKWRGKLAKSLVFTRHIFALGLLKPKRRQQEIAQIVDRYGVPRDPTLTLTLTLTNPHPNANLGQA